MTPERSESQEWCFDKYLPGCISTLVFSNANVKLFLKHARIVVSYSINLMCYHLQIKFTVCNCAKRHMCAVCTPLMANKLFLLTITWGVLSQMPPFQTPDSQSAPLGQSSGLGGRSPALRPLGALPWCSFSRGVTREGPNARQGSGVWDDGDKEPEKVKEDGKCFEWMKRRRDEEERRRARMRWGENLGVQG